MPIEAVGNVAQTIVVDKIFITGFSVTSVPGNEAIIISYSAGFHNIDGKFVTVNTYRFTLAGEDFIRVAGLTPDTSAGLFAALEVVLIAEVTKDAMSK